MVTLWWDAQRHAFQAVPVSLLSLGMCHWLGARGRLGKRGFLPFANRKIAGPVATVEG